jgi:hypothetical protein
MTLSGAARQAASAKAAASTKGMQKRGTRAAPAGKNGEKHGMAPSFCGVLLCGSAMIALHVFYISATCFQ